MFRKKTRAAAPELWIATSDLPTTPATSFYLRLAALLTECGFGDAVRALCAPYYEMDASKGGQPGIDPEVYCKMLMVGFFENLRSERAIAARCADSLAIRAYLHYELHESTPHHSSLTVIAQRLPLEVYDAVFTLILGVLTEHGLVKGKRLAIDSSVMEANASLASLEHRFTKERYRDFVKRLAKEAGIDTSDPRAVSAFDRKRKGRTTSNTEWVNPHDPDAKVGPDKKGATRMLYKPEHVADLDTGAIVDVTLRLGDEADHDGMAVRVLNAEARVNEAAGDEPDVARTEIAVADGAYFALPEAGRLQDLGIRTAIPDRVPKRNLDTLTPVERQTVRRAKRTRTSASGRAAMRKRGEYCERSFVHTLDYGGGRRTPLRGQENILKRHYIRAACFNLSLLLRQRTGLGTLKQTWAAAAAAIVALILVLGVLFRGFCDRWWPSRLLPAPFEARHPTFRRYVAAG